MMESEDFIALQKDSVEKTTILCAKPIPVVKFSDQPVEVMLLVSRDWNSFMTCLLAITWYYWGNCALIVVVLSWFIINEEFGGWLLSQENTWLVSSLFSDSVTQDFDASEIVWKLKLLLKLFKTFTNESQMFALFTTQTTKETFQRYRNLLALCELLGLFPLNFLCCCLK